MRTPEITSAPEMPASVEGMVSLRGSLVPVIDLAKYAGIISEKRPEIMIVTEYNGHTQGFLVEAVDTILRLDWAAMRVPPDMITNRMGGLVTAVTELDAGTLVMMMDVEKVLAETAMYGDEHQFVNIEPLKEERMVYFADDLCRSTQTDRAYFPGHASQVRLRHPTACALGMTCSAWLARQIWPAAS